MWSDFCGKVMSFPVSSPRLARVPVCILLLLYCFIVQHGSHWELHLIACLDKGFLRVFTSIVSSVGCSAARTQEELENDDWPLSTHRYVNGGAAEAKSQWPRGKDGMKLNVWGNKLGDLYPSGRSWLDLYWTWLLNTGAPEVLCGLRNFPLTSSKS